VKKKIKNSDYMPDIEVDRGQPIIATAMFACDPGDEPDEVYFTYTRPGSGEPVTDDGLGQPNSKLEHVGLGAYRYVIRTRDFSGGEGFFKFTAGWKAQTGERPYDEAAVVGAYRVRAVPPQLL
jgi:hypothetical protein